MIARLRSLARDNRGAALIELAIVAPVLGLMTVGVIDMANAFGQKLKLEQAAHRSIEKIMQTTGVLTVEQTVAAEAVCQYNGVNTDGSCKTAPITVANVTVTHRLECDAVVSTAADCAEGEVEARWIQVSVWDEYEPMFPIHFSGIEANGKYMVTATAGIRTA